jgi:hypothetical protein
MDTFLHGDTEVLEKFISKRKEMKTDMPEVISIIGFGSWNSGGFRNTDYVHSDKHEELKAIAEKMAVALDYCQLKLANSDYDSTVLRPISNIRKEYNKFIGVK